jgi:hypothetical protein
LTPTPEHQISFGELSHPISIALGRLPTNQREALVLREIEGMNYADIADVLGTSLENIKVILHRARNSFKDNYAVRILAEEQRSRCELLGELLDTFADGEALTAQEDALVRQHIKQCSSCEQRKREIAAIAILLRGMPQSTSVKSRRQSARKASKPHAGTLGAILAIGLIVVMLIAGGGVYWFVFRDPDAARSPGEPDGFGGGAEETPDSVSAPDISATATAGFGLSPATLIAQPSPTANVASEPSAESPDGSSSRGAGSTNQTCTANSTDGICCAEASETYLTSPTECQAPVPACGSACVNDGQCAGLGPNPACAGGGCWDQQTCGGSSDGGNPGDGNNGGDGGSSCVPSPPACDFKDNDCDGKVDEYPDDCFFG